MKTRLAPTNANLYHYAGNNPVKYTDPDGRALHVLIGAVIGAVVGAGTTAVKDVLSGQVSDLATYAGAIAGGAVSGAIMAATGNGTLAGAAGAAVGNITKQTINIAEGKQEKFEAVDFVADVAIGATFGKLCSAENVPGITSGKGSMQSVAKQLTTKLDRGIIQNISVKSSAKIAVSRTVKCAITGGTVMGMATKDAIDDPVVKPLQKKLDKAME